MERGFCGCPGAPLFMRVVGAWCILRTDEVCCVARMLCADGSLLLWRILVEVRTLLCGAYSVRGLGLVAWHIFRAAGFLYCRLRILCVAKPC